LLGGWLCGKGHWGEWHSTEAEVRAVTPIPDGLVLTGRNGITMRNVTAFAQRGFLAGVGRASSMRGSGASSSSTGSGSASGSSGSASALADMKSRVGGASGVSSALVTATSSAARRSELLGAAAGWGWEWSSGGECAPQHPHEQPATCSPTRYPTRPSSSPSPLRPSLCTAPIFDTKFRSVSGIAP
jgi:hypothetical protein